MRQVYTLHSVTHAHLRPTACSVDDKRGMSDVVPVGVYRALGTRSSVLSFQAWLRFETGVLGFLVGLFGFFQAGAGMFVFTRLHEVQADGRAIPQGFDGRAVNALRLGKFFLDADLPADLFDIG